MATQGFPHHDPCWTGFETAEEKKAKNESRAKLRKVLQTSPEDVFEISSDGQVYTKPDMLRGVPVAKITEASPYWERSWSSLDAVLEKQAPEADLRKEVHRCFKFDSKNVMLRKEKKRLDDNSSKFTKIREIFGDGPYHPNQIAAKHHLPQGGFCTMENMYKLACKISDMRELYRHGELKMDPFDFIRWRLAKMASEALTYPGQRSANLKTLVSNLGACTEDSKYQDPIMREACLLAAEYQGRLNSYGSKKRGRAQGVLSRTSPYPLSSNASLFANVRKLAAATIADETQCVKSEPGGGQTLLKAEKSSQQVHQSTGYSGVNGFRAKRQRASNGNHHSDTTQ